MSISISEAEFEVRATKVTVTDELLTVEFDDGRTVSLPVQWYPRLAHGTAKERAEYQCGAFGIGWPALDEELSYKSLILGWRSGENPESLKFWLDNRRKGRRTNVQDWMKQRRQNKAPSASARKRQTA